MTRPKESIKSIIFNVVIPCLLCLSIFSLSLYLDIENTNNKMFWLQRSGSVITILGVWIAFHEARESMKLVDGSLFIETNLPYKYISLSIIIIGTLLWGYGDIPFKWTFNKTE